MMRARYASDLKLCLDILARFEVYPDLAQLDYFLSNKTNRERLNECAAQIMQTWQDSMDVCLNPSESWQSYLNTHLEDETFSSPIVAVEQQSNALNGVNLQKSLPKPSGILALENTEDISATALETEILKPEQATTRFKLSNATMGKAYQAHLEGSAATGITILSIDGLDNLGLTYDLTRNTLTGTPEKAGEFLLTVHYQNNNDSVKTQNLSLIINNNPQNLWKNIVSDPNMAFWKPDCVYQGITGFHNWKLAAASKRGRSHAHVGNCRDDDFAMKVDNASCWQIIAVADGAGSCEYSREGARIVAQNSVEVLSAQLQHADLMLTRLIENWQLNKNLDNDIALQQVLAEVFSTALRNSIETIIALAKQQQVSYRDFYSTLLIAAHKTFPQGEFVATYWIGDGGLGLYNAGEKIKILGMNDSGEYAGQTRFLDSHALETDDLFGRLRFSSQKNFTALVLMTDGITDPLFETDSNLRTLSYWDALWEQIQPYLDSDPQLTGQKLTEWLDFWSPGNHDDRTIALLYK